MFPSVSFFSELFESQLTGIPVVPLLDLQADTGVSVSNVNKVDSWADQSGNGYNFTQTGATRPVLATVGGYPCLQFNDGNNSLTGQNWPAFDNPTSMTVFAVTIGYDGVGYGLDYISKVYAASPGDPGWEVYAYNSQVPPMVGLGFEVNDIHATFDDNLLWVDNYSGTTTAAVLTAEMISFTEVHSYINGSRAGEIIKSAGTVENSTNTEPVRIGTQGDPSWILPSYGNLCAIRVYSPALIATQRVAVEQELANRYGITL